MTAPDRRLRGAAILRMALRVAVILAVGYAAHLLIGWTEVQSDYEAGGMMAWTVVTLVLLSYAVLIAIPYVPGIEIGLTILMMQGASAVPGVYAATVLGLMLGYLGGRFLPHRWLCGLFRDLGLARAAALLERVAPLSPAERLATLRDRLPGRLGKVLIGWRYLLLALVLNLPGNWILGGGGGIMMVAGLSGLFRHWATTLTIALAVAPVPLAFWTFDIKIF